MSDLFSGLGGIRFPDVVMNSGPLPPSGGLPAPLHDTADARINYGSTLLGDLTPYAYGEPGYQSSQNSYLNIPHRIQKFVPVLHLPEPTGQGTFRLSHAVDDGDIAFVMRLERNSIFCTGTRGGGKRNSLGTVVDPLCNLATLNYIMAGLQVSLPVVAGKLDKANLWQELLYNLDRKRWNQTARDYSLDMDRIDYNWEGDARASTLEYPRHEPFGLDDLIHLVRHCIKPFGIVRGSEKQGGQSEMTSGPATWPVPTVATLVLDGKEGDVCNIWHKSDINAGDDLVLRFKLMPLEQYTLNHYYKGFAKKSFNSDNKHVGADKYVWQLVPDVYGLDHTEHRESDLGKIERDVQQRLRSMYTASHQTRQFAVLREHIHARRSSKRMPDDLKRLFSWVNVVDKDVHDKKGLIPWQQMGFWHIGRCQIMSPSYGVKEFYNNDMAEQLRLNHLDMTFQPMFVKHYTTIHVREPERKTRGATGAGLKRPWAAALRLEKLGSGPGEDDAPGWYTTRRAVVGEDDLQARQADKPEVDAHDKPDRYAARERTVTFKHPLGGQDEVMEEAAPSAASLEVFSKQDLVPDLGKTKRRKAAINKAIVEGSLLKVDGTSESHSMQIL